MADVFSKIKRSAVMARVRSRGNKSTEQRLLMLFRAFGLKGWRRHYPIFGSPDFVFCEKKLAVFIDGCFWHGCPKHGRMPSSNIQYWERKIARNRTRDQLVSKTLRKKGWRVVRIWEHELARKTTSILVKRISRRLACP